MLFIGSENKTNHVIDFCARNKLPIEMISLATDQHYSCQTNTAIKPVFITLDQNDQTASANQVNTWDNTNNRSVEQQSTAPVRLPMHKINGFEVARI